MARKSKVPTPAELARLYGAGHDALTAALDAGCLPSDLQNKWPNLLGTLRRVEGQPYHHPWVKDPLTDDEKRVLAWEFRKAAQRAEEALAKCKGRAANPSPGNPRDLAVGDAVQFRFEPETVGVIQSFEPNVYGEKQGWALVSTRRGERRVPTHALRLLRSASRLRNNPAPWAKVFG